MSASRPLLLIRHCQSSGQEPEAGLTAAGRQQAQELARFLAEMPVDRIVASSYRRARQTIAPFAARAGLPVQLDERLIERRLAADPIDNWREIVRDSFTDLDLCAAGGESGRDVQARGWAVLQELRQSDHALPVAVSHGNLISLILHSLDPSFRYAQWETLSNPDVYLLQAADDGPWRFQRLWS